jgi:hypothetical protein
MDGWLIDCTVRFLSLIGRLKVKVKGKVVPVLN